ncbi:tRNA (adenosine(37)-N6)-threonylcarbamoyltransferase complex transferase subunit TsaD [bacterium]|nr:tRNA (adenosine(37)-N6)-threonylcarbamoyltransferase complex transferase subunit TsaD [bacterium]
MKILGIESSCDETSAAVVTEQREVLASVVASQLKVHAPYGGVVPELASRQHLRDLPRVIDETFSQAGLSWDDIDGIAATCGPGLMGALLVGLTWAKAAAFARQLPFIGINHLEGHLFASELNHPALPYPFVGLVASGGHTNLYLVTAGDLPEYELLASTRDDAVGEAFDKVAKLLGMPYPGGPAIEAAAKNHPQSGIRFTLPRMKDGSADFSYSGIKTAVRYLLESSRKAGKELVAAEIAAGFQKTVIEDLVRKTLAVIQKHEVHALVLTGGVAANRSLREAFSAAAHQEGIPFFSPPVEWCTDNAAMIASVGARYLAAGRRSAWDLPAYANLASMDS